MITAGARLQSERSREIVHGSAKPQKSPVLPSLSPHRFTALCYTADCCDERSECALSRRVLFYSAESAGRSQRCLVSGRWAGQPGSDVQLTCSSIPLISDSLDILYVSPHLVSTPSPLGASNDVRALVGDDSALESGILPALEQYNLEQLVVAALPSSSSSSSSQLLICEAGSIPSSTSTRYIDPSTSLAWLFDHLRLAASDPKEVIVDSACEEIRKQLQDEAQRYAKEHFSEGVSKVFTTEQKRLKPDPKPKKARPEAATATVADTEETIEQAAKENVENPVLEETPAKLDTQTKDDVMTASTGEPAVSIAEGDSSSARQADGTGTEDSEMASTAATPAPEISGGGNDATMDTETETETNVDLAATAGTSGAADEPVAQEDAGTVQVQQVALAERTDGTDDTAAVADAASEEQEEEEETPTEPLAKKFAFYFVGNKYNPSNYWYVPPNAVLRLIAGSNVLTS